MKDYRAISIRVMHGTRLLSMSETIKQITLWFLRFFFGGNARDLWEICALLNNNRLICHSRRLQQNRSQKTTNKQTIRPTNLTNLIQLLLIQLIRWCFMWSNQTESEFHFIWLRSAVYHNCKSSSATQDVDIRFHFLCSLFHLRETLTER